MFKTITLLVLVGFPDAPLRGHARSVARAMRQNQNHVNEDEEQAILGYSQTYSSA